MTRAELERAREIIRANRANWPARAVEILDGLLNTIDDMDREMDRLDGMRVYPMSEGPCGGTRHPAAQQTGRKPSPATAEDVAIEQAHAKAGEWVREISYEDLLTLYDRMIKKAPHMVAPLLRPIEPPGPGRAGYLRTVLCVELHAFTLAEANGVHLNPHRPSGRPV